MGDENATWRGFDTQLLLAAAKRYRWLMLAHERLSPGLVEPLTDPSVWDTPQIPVITALGNVLVRHAAGERRDDTLEHGARASRLARAEEGFEGVQGEQGARGAIKGRHEAVDNR